MNKKIKRIELVKNDGYSAETHIWKIKGTTIEVHDVLKRTIIDKTNEIIDYLNKKG